ncbi:hypothetical protein LEP1GSC086_0590 [Leptospira weilii str. LNT 1234]|nr:hypothetical protein LEP1GSC086_0590 [Leptospira weilii str. LNT 1234]
MYIRKILTTKYDPRSLDMWNRVSYKIRWTNFFTVILPTDLY